MTAAPVEFDHSASGFVADPYPAYRRFRDSCPVGRTSAFGGFWFYSRYDDVLAAELDPVTYSSAHGVTIPAVGGGLPSIPLECDPPDHPAFRSILQPSFSRRAIARFEDPIRRIVRQQLESFASAGEADLARQLAVPVPPLVIAALFGLPAADCPRFRHLAETMVGGGPDSSEAGQELVAYLGEQLAQRAENPRDDLATLIAQAQLPGRAISDEERLGMAMLTVVAGHETTVGSIASLLAAVGSDPALQQRLRDDASLIPVAVEESLRLEAPVQNFARTLTCPVEREGTVLPAGDRVMLLYGSANRDERQFDAPDTFRLDRPRNHHLSFGAGIHRCLGAPLGVLEMRVALEEVLRTIPGFVVDPEAVTVAGMIARTFTSVPATWPITGGMS